MALLEGEGISVIGSLLFVLVSFLRGKQKCKFDISGFLLEVWVGEKVGGKGCGGEGKEGGESRSGGNLCLLFTNMSCRNE